MVLCRRDIETGVAPERRPRACHETRHANAMCGILCVDKPNGPTSHDMVSLIRRRTGIRRVGHTGTLDPLATGLLVMVLGRATKWSPRLTGRDKDYDVTVAFGTSTDTGDSTGQIIQQAPAHWTCPDVRTVQMVMEKLTGTQQQIPPMYSAIKQGGQPLYKLARKGLTVARAPRMITVHAWTVVQCADGQLISKVRCSSGTYVRTLAETLGARLGGCAHVTALRRTRVGEYDISQSVTADWLVSASADDIAQRLLTIEPREASACAL
jgi:tRNA pseudouridine55 synthase